MDSARLKRRPDIHWDDIPASVRLWKRLKEAGIHTAADLAKMTERQLPAIPGIGHRCLEEARTLLLVHGLAFQRERARARWTEAELDTLAALRQPGLSWAEIGKCYGISKQHAVRLQAKRGKNGTKNAA